MKTNLVHDVRLIAACGLYCGNCGKYKQSKCPGCIENTKASWCKIRSCCIHRGMVNCSACIDYPNPLECAKYNNFISKVIGFFTSTDRSKSIEFIKINGPENFVTIMSESGKMSMPHARKN